jgi:hypothetical protein
MESKLYLDVLPQPDDITCGPTCLHGVYRYFGDEISLKQVIDEVRPLNEGGTLAVYLANHALHRGYKASIYTYNLQIFDPTWFQDKQISIYEKLELQIALKRDSGLKECVLAYLHFLEHGGEIRFEDLTAGLIRKFLNRSVPILTGLSATYLYSCAREYVKGQTLVYDDVRGVPTGHFVVLSGYDKERRTVLIADPYRPNPVSPYQKYEVDIDRLVCAIMLGILTFDANLLIVESK